MIFEELDEYTNDIKRLRKKYRTLAEDMEVVKKVLQVNPDERPPFSYRIDNLGLKTCVIKVKKIASKSFKGRGANSGFRLIYAHFGNEDKIVLVELFHKSIKELEDRKRIFEHFD
jgi:mRNA-degrading endonuclease RelE of RelBE toxin-antitoxin system